MDKLEKVIKGVECHKNMDCDKGCPYRKYARCKNKLFKEISLHLQEKLKYEKSIQKMGGDKG